MKKFAYLSLALVLTAALFTGCGCTNQNMGRDPMPTIMPTTTTAATTAPTTAPTQATTQMTTEPSNATNGTEATADRGNGPLEDSTNAATEESVERRNRSAMPNVR